MSDSQKPIAFVSISTNHGTMIVNRYDYRLTDSGGYGVGYQLLNTSSFDQEEVNFVKQLLLLRRQYFGDGVVSIDCGANIGVHTIEWAKLMTGWGTVLAIEAQERIFYALAGNITLNNCFNARAIWAAIGEREGTIGVPNPNYLTPSSFGSLEIKKVSSTEYIGQDIDYANTSATRLTTIDGLQLERLDFIKIDIEGMELESLAGGENSIKRYRPVMVVEKIKSNEGELVSFMHSHGYSVYPLGINILAVHNDDPIIKHLPNSSSV